jgi:hypothetical protein
VASVLIEKPTCGDFLPIIDGGFQLQYSPLMEYRHGKGLIIFCQMDVTGRTEADPAATHLVGNILRYANEWKPKEKMKVMYRGDDAIGEFFHKIGVSTDRIEQNDLQRFNYFLVLGPGYNSPNMPESLREGARKFALGLSQDDLKHVFPNVATKENEHISTYFEPFKMDHPLCGIGPADVHNRDPKNYPLITDEKIAVGNGSSGGILGVTDDGRTVICAMAPWQFPSDKQSFKRTFRRSAFLVSRILGNMNVDLRTPLMERFHGTVEKDEKRWLTGLYLDTPEEWDDPYRFFRW